MNPDKFPEFIGEIREFKRIVLGELSEIKKDIKSLNEFKWKILGIASLVGMLGGGVSQLIFIWIQNQK